MKVRDEFKIIDTTKLQDDPFLKAMTSTTLDKKKLLQKYQRIRCLLSKN